MSAGAPSPSQAPIVADIWRDPWGVPHIKAKSRADVFVALGFAHARDRLWQMEALLRRGTGRYAEWMGKSARLRRHPGATSRRRGRVEARFRPR